MSIDALSWAFNLDMPSPGAKLTLLALANYANEDGIAYPSLKSLAKKTSQSIRTVQSNLGLLERLGLVARTQRLRANGSTTSALYTLKVGAGTPARADGPRGAERRAQPQSARA